MTTEQAGKPHVHEWNCSGCDAGPWDGKPLREPSSSGVSATNRAGTYVPAIPLPLFVGWKLRKCRCDCGDVFRSQLRYREHYAYAHILGY